MRYVCYLYSIECGSTNTTQRTHILPILMVMICYFTYAHVVAAAAAAVAVVVTLTKICTFLI